MINTFFSNRIYKNNIPEVENGFVKDTLIVANRAKHYAYKLLLLEEKGLLKQEKSIHLMVKEKYSINDYFANSAVQLAKGILKSQKELQIKYIRDTESQIQKRKKKIATVKRLVTSKAKILESIIAGSFKTTKRDREFASENLYYVEYKNKTDIYYNLYDFEHIYLRPEIKKLKNRIRNIEYSITLFENKLLKLKKGVSGACFGSAKLFTKQYTDQKYIKTHTLWRKEFTSARYKSFQVSGRKDAKYGNFVFKYTPDTKVLELVVNDKSIVFNDISFPYGQEHVDYALINQKQLKKPIAWTIEDHEDYYLFKVAVDVQHQENTNFSKIDGVIGIDINYDHFAWSEADAKGMLISHGIVSYDLQSKTSGQAIKIIEKSICELVAIAKEKNKPIVREDLDLDETKAKMKYNNPNSNRKISQFAYNKIISGITSRCHKEGIEVFAVNPAFTSQIGKIKYMKQKGISVHTSASYVIARRGMGFKEKIPPVLFSILPESIVCRHHWVHWSFLHKHVKDFPIEAFYKLSSTKMCCSVDEYVELLKWSSA